MPALIYRLKYNIIQDDRPTLGGGTVIVLKYCIKYFIPPKLTLCFIESNSIILEHDSTRNATSSYYKKPTTYLDTNDFTILAGLLDRAIITGDFNCKYFN